MTPINSSILFASVIYIVVLFESFIEIYAFEKYERAIGGRFENLLETAVVAIPISLSIAIGYAAVLAYRRRANGVSRLAVRWVVGSALIACAFLEVYPFVASSFPDSWRLGIVGAAVYCFVLGAVIAASVVAIPQSHANAL